MIVISKKSTRRLIKDHKYEVSNLWNGSGNRPYHMGKLELIEINGFYPVEYFTDSSGNDISNINYHKFLQSERLSPTDVSEGEILMCVVDSYKTMYKDHLYKIEKIHKKEEQRRNYQNINYTHVEYSIKFEGVKRRLKFNGYSFRKLTPGESRDISLDTILYNKEPEITRNSSLRKFDMVENKNKALMEFISRSILDKSRHHLSIIEWGCKKMINNVGLESSDFDEILDMKLSDILKSIETNK